MSGFYDWKCNVRSSLRNCKVANRLTISVLNAQHSALYVATGLINVLQNFIVFCYKKLFTLPQRRSVVFVFVILFISVVFFIFICYHCTNHKLTSPVKYGSLCFPLYLVTAVSNIMLNSKVAIASPSLIIC